VNSPSFCWSRCAAFILVAFSVLLSSCGKNRDEETASPAPQPSTRPSVAHTKLQSQMDGFGGLPYEHDPARRPLVLSERITNARDWLLSILRKGYAETARTNAQWDAAADLALQAYANYSRVSADAHNFSALTNAIVSVIAKGCNDPMVQNMQLRYGLSESNRTQQEFAIASMDVFRAMILSHQHPLLKFMAGLRAVDAARDAEPKSDRSRPIGQVTAALEDLARDTNAPASEVFDPAFMWVEHSTAKGWSDYVMSDLQGIIEQTWGQDERFFRLRGLTEIDRAWSARGGGYANTVTDQGWEQFKTHLNQAALSLEKSWSLNPSNAYTAYLMMKVELGQGQGRARMEKWFNRAMDLAPNYYDAVDLMEFYLQPRWYGSDEIALEFARSCVSSTNWGGQVPLVLANLHRSLADYHELKDSPRYWQKPGVWEDVRSSYDKFFQLNPNDYGYRHNYARDAYSCGHYEEFLAQAKSFPWTNFQFFGGEAHFHEMIRRASSK
jgi:hypothetical protein